MTTQKQDSMTMKEAGEETEKMKHQRHLERKEALQKRINALRTELATREQANQADEVRLTAAFEAADRQYTDALAQYDFEMRTHVEELKNAQNEFEEKAHEKNQLKEEWEQRLDEKRKHNEIQTIIKQKEEENERKRLLLDNAAQWVQAHWRGLLARREGEKARKKNKKKKKKK